MAFVRAPFLKHQFLDQNGRPLVGGLVYTYLAGTSTPVATYTDKNGSVPHPNPIVLDSAGSAEIWLSDASAYKFVVKDADGVDQDTFDFITAPGGVSPGSETAWVTHEINDGQSATDLEGETIDFDLYSSALYEVEIVRGSTVFANGQFALQIVGGGPRVRTGGFIGDAHGVTFSLDLVEDAIYQLKAACSSGHGNGTVKLSRRLVAASN